MKKILEIVPLFIILVIGMTAGGLTARLSNADTINCQYPDRLTNTDTYCDNSDPPCGEVAKGASECPINTVEKKIVPTEVTETKAQETTDSCKSN